MIQKTVNKLACLFQKREESKYSNAHILKMDRSIQLNNYSCGIVCAFVILRYYRKINSANEIKYDKKLLKKEGIDTEPLLSILRFNGVKVKVDESADLAKVKQAIKKGHPMLISIDNGEHWVVVYGFSKNRIFVLDSSLKSNLKCSMDNNEFLKRWDENWVAVVSS